MVAKAVEYSSQGSCRVARYIRHLAAYLKPEYVVFLVSFISSSISHYHCNIFVFRIVYPISAR
ncbi:hypothetical protein LINPERHAP2_LOCUS27854 [Linum perenne]